MGERNRWYVKAREQSLRIGRQEDRATHTIGETVGRGYT